MNRRTVLRSGVALGAVGLAGCLDDLEMPFSLSTPVSVVVHNQTEEAYNIELLAYDPETRQDTYQEGFSVTPDERVIPSNLGGSDQRLRVTLFELDGDQEEGLVEEVEIAEDTLEVNVRVLDAGEEPDLEIEVTIREDEDEERNETVVEPDEDVTGNETSESEDDES